jgi:hypothetical protein
MKLKPRQPRPSPQPVQKHRAIEAPQLDTFEQINLNAAGLDIGDRSIHV